MMGVQRWGVFEDVGSAQMIHMEGGPFVLRDEVREKILDYYRVAPKAAVPLLRVLGMETA